MCECLVDDSSAVYGGCLRSVWVCMCVAVDMKEGKPGEVYEGQPRSGTADCTLTIEDGNFLALHTGKLAPQQVDISLQKGS